MVAGAVSGGILTLTAACAAILSFIFLANPFLTLLIVSTTALFTAICTYAIWHRVVSGAAINMLIGLALTVWLCVRGEVAIAIVIFVPAICGPVSAARGIYVLKKLSER